jgi:hypothetical protein
MAILIISAIPSNLLLILPRGRTVSLADGPWATKPPFFADSYFRSRIVILLVSQLTKQIIKVLPVV